MSLVRIVRSAADRVLVRSTGGQAVPTGSSPDRRPRRKVGAEDAGHESARRNRPSWLAAGAGTGCVAIIRGPFGHHEPYPPAGRSTRRLSTNSDGCRAPASDLSTPRPHRPDGVQSRAGLRRRPRAGATVVGGAPAGPTKTPEGTADPRSTPGDAEHLRYRSVQGPFGQRSAYAATGPLPRGLSTNFAICGRPRPDLSTARQHRARAGFPLPSRPLRGQTTSAPQPLSRARAARRGRPRRAAGRLRRGCPTRPSAGGRAASRARGTTSARRAERREPGPTRVGETGRR